ncbi:M20 aminoacylase family protein [Terrarubrum flagellatum]|uniref:M20 aminoacylase family protein n=1 Tax=Terrirubrum flagellatum TaxID=2895980 RepID=UPI0031456D89
MTIHIGVPSTIRTTIGAFSGDFVALRREFHQAPELAFKEFATSAWIAELLESWGYRVTRDIATTGIVATLKCGTERRSIGIRADFDALPIQEATGLSYASKHPGRMHACGHDGHTAILLAAARYLAKTRRFDGTLRLFFQPAEEIGAGAKAMIADGVLERFPVDAIYALHNWPSVPAGAFGFVEGPAMASVDKAIVTVKGKGGHGAASHETVDPIVAAAHVVTALQTIVSRNVDPLDMAVVTVGSIHGGTASNVIPDKVELQITTRTFRDEVRKRIESRIVEIASRQAEAFGASADVDYRRGYPTVVNHRSQTELAREVAADLFGSLRLISPFAPRTASEDFAYFLEKRPGAYLFVGNGSSAPLHSPEYDFNDDIIEVAASFWAALVERSLAPSRATDPH